MNFPPVQFYVAPRYVSGNRVNQTSGVLGSVGFPNVFSMVAGRSGIRLLPAVCVQAAGISGYGQCAWPATAGRYMKIGMKNRIVIQI